jgi:DNA-binding NarL/FixJ family response regulator
VVGEASTGPEAVERAVALQPDIVLLDLASKLLQRLNADAAAAETLAPLAEPLTECGHEVLRLVAQGRPNKEIAAQLAISERTVKFHVSSTLSKLGAVNRTGAVTLAVQRGLIDLGA